MKRPSPPPGRTRRRLAKILGVCIALMAGIVFLVPYVLSADFFRRNIEKAMSEALGVRVQLASYSLSWFSGLSVEGLTVPNPQGYSQEEGMLELRSMNGAISFLQLLRGRVDLSGTVEGLEIRVHQKVDGSTNLEELFDIDLDIDERGRGRSRRPIDDLPSRGNLEGLRLDLNLVDALVEISHEERGVLESLRELNGSIGKEFGDGDLQLAMRAKIHRPNMPENPGRVALAVDVDTNWRRPMEVYFDSNGLDLARYKPLLTFLLPPEQITALEGIVSGTLTSRYDYRSTVSLEGSLTVEEPRLAGALFAGMDIRAPRWVINPHLQIELPEGDQPPRLEAEKTFIDLGFCQISGVSASELPQIGKPSLGFRYTLDLDAVEGFGGSLLSELDSRGGTAQGTLVLPLVGGLDKPFDLVDLHAEGQLSLPALRFESFEVKDLRGDYRLAGGIFQLETRGGMLNSGSVDFQAKADLQDLGEIPLELDFAWQDGTVVNEAVRTLRYVVPLLAGLEQGPRLDFRSGISSELHLTGPATPRGGEHVLEWLNRWRGNGQLQLKGGSFTPAPELQALLQATGNEGRLQIDELDTTFAISEGHVETALLKLESKGRRYGIQGRTSLDGTIDHALDLAEMFKGHRDGERIRRVLGDQKLLAQLKGTLDEPQLVMPEITDALQSILQGTIEKGLLDLLKKIRR